MRLQTLIESKRKDYFAKVMTLTVLLEDGRTLALHDPFMSQGQNGEKRMKNELSAVVDMYGDGIFGDGQNPAWKHREDRVWWIFKRLRYKAAQELRAIVDEELSARTPLGAPPPQGADFKKWETNALRWHFFEYRYGSRPSKRQPQIDEVIASMPEMSKDSIVAGTYSVYGVFNKIIRQASTGSLRDYLDTIKNFAVTMPDNPLANLLWKNQTCDELIAQLDEAQRQTGEMFREKYAGLMAKGEKLVDYGNGLAWWDTQASYLPEEGHLGHHCGNIQRCYAQDNIPGTNIPMDAGLYNGVERIISLRKTEGEGDHVKVKDVFMTFIYHDFAGYFGEMKAQEGGYGNRKPPEKYHKWIVDLLSLPRWKYVRGSGPSDKDAQGRSRSTPDANFCLFQCSGMSRALRGWTDLSPELAKQLHDAHPSIWLYTNTMQSHTTERGRKEQEVCQYCHHVYPNFEKIVEEIKGKNSDVPLCAKTMGVEAEVAAEVQKRKINKIGQGNLQQDLDRLVDEE